MKLREILASLAALLDDSNERFINSDAAKALLANPETVVELEKLYLPEITRVVCNSPELLETEWGKKYKYVSELYTNDFIMEETINRYLRTRSSETLESGVLDLASYKHLKMFFNAAVLSNKKCEKVCNDQKEINAKLASLKGELDIVTKRLNELNEEELQLSNNGDLEFEEIEKRKEKIEKTISAQKAKKTLKENKIAELTKKNTAYNRIISEEQAFLEERKGFFEKVKMRIKEYDEIIGKCREIAYNSELKQSKLESIISKLISNEKINEDEISYLKSESFPNDFFRSIEKSDDAPKIIPVIAHLYNEGYIDIYEDPLTSYLYSHVEDIINYVIKQQTDIKSDVFADDYNEWLELLLSFAVENDVLIDFNKHFADLWCSFKTVNDWTTVIDYLTENSKMNLNECLCYLFLNTDGISRKVVKSMIEETVFGENASERAFSEFVRILLNCKNKGDNLNTEYAMQLITEFEADKQKELRDYKRKYQKAENRLERYEQEQSGLFFNRVYEPIEALEKIGIELDASVVSKEKQNFSYRYIDGIKHEIIKQLAALRENMIDLGVEPLSSIDDWANGKEVSFDNTKHSFVGSEKPEKVHLKTVGFKYVDDEGIPKIRFSEAYKVSNPASEQHNSAEKRKTSNKSKKSKKKESDSPDNRKENNKGTSQSKKK
jgi:hypothetical protein